MIIINIRIYIMFVLIKKNKYIKYNMDKINGNILLFQIVNNKKKTFKNNK